MLARVLRPASTLIARIVMSNPLYDRLFAPLSTHSAPFLVAADGTSMTGDAFLSNVHCAVAALRALGVRPGDRVAVQIAKTPEAMAVYAATVAVGAVFLPLNTAYTPAEVEYFIGDAEPTVLLVDPTKHDQLAPIAARYGAGIRTLDAMGRGSFRDLCDAQGEDVVVASRQQSDLAALLYTSGTTGRSKGAMLSHGNLLSNAEALVSAWQFDTSDVLLHALPIFHTHGLFVATHVALLSGAKMLFLPGFDVEAVLGSLPHATALMGVPTFYTRLLDDPRFDRALVAHMRLFVSGSAPLLAETHRAFEARTGHRILERYGMTETNMNTSNPYDGARRPGTVGMPLPNVEVRVSDPATGTPLPIGETGMVEVRGPNVCQGYWRMPEKTREAFREDGFFITGDLGFFDAEAYLNLVGRDKDLIITGGYNVYPKEVELLLDEQPGVLESAVIGLPHPDFGEAVFAVLVAQPSADGAEAVLDLGAIAAAMREQLARYKQPKAMVVLPELPRNTMGKVQKNLLRERFVTKFALDTQR
jgi:malonyl-CoA/methylmalonyl-CoA synthetase